MNLRGEENGSAVLFGDDGDHSIVVFLGELPRLLLVFLELEDPGIPGKEKRNKKEDGDGKKKWRKGRRRFSTFSRTLEAA